jgi:Transposase
MSSGAPIFDADLNPMLYSSAGSRRSLTPPRMLFYGLPRGRRTRCDTPTNRSSKPPAPFEQLGLVGAVADDGVNSRAESFAGCVRCRPVTGQVPSKLSAQVRVFATANGRKTDPVDAHSVAMVALRTPNLVRVEVEDELVVMAMLVDRRDELGQARTQTINRLHRLLLELFPGGRRNSCHRTRPAR